MIAEIIGKNAYLKLQESEYSGIYYSVPTSLKSGRGEKLVSIIGNDDAKKLIDYAGGTRIYIKKHSAIKQRALEIKKMRDSGLSVKKIAAEFSYQAKYTDRQITNLLRIAEES